MHTWNRIELIVVMIAFLYAWACSVRMRTRWKIFDTALRMMNFSTAVVGCGDRGITEFQSSCKKIKSSPLVRHRIIRDWAVHYSCDWMHLLMTFINLVFQYSRATWAGKWGKAAVKRSLVRLAITFIGAEKIPRNSSFISVSAIKFIASCSHLL